MSGKSLKLLVIFGLSIIFHDLLIGFLFFVTANDNLLVLLAFAFFLLFSFGCYFFNKKNFFIFFFGLSLLFVFSFINGNFFHSEFVARYYLANFIENYSPYEGRLSKLYLYKGTSD